MTVRQGVYRHADTHTGTNKIQLYAMHRSTLYTKTQTGPFLHSSKPSTAAGSLDSWSPCVRSTRDWDGVEDAGLASRLTEREELVRRERWPRPELHRPRSYSKRASLRSSQYLLPQAGLHRASGPSLPQALGALSF